jgi:hypothetical protein
MVGVQKQGDVVLVQIEGEVYRIPVSESTEMHFHRVRLDTAEDDDA